MSDRTRMMVAAVLVASAAVVITFYGWLPAINAVYPLFLAGLWASVLAVASWGAGTLGVRVLYRTDDLRFERVVLTLALGTALLIACAGILATLHLATRPVLLAVLAAWACRGAVLVSRLRPSWQSTVQWPHIPPTAIFLGAAGMTLIAATSFAPFYDQWNYHLAFPYQWLRAGTVVTYPLHGYSFLPANSGLLFLYGLAGPGPWGAQVAHWWFGLLAAGGSAAVAGQLGAKPLGRLLAAVVFFATPSVIQLGTLAGSDLGVAAFGIAGVIALLEMHRSPERSLRWFFAAGLFAGLAAGAKYTAIGQIVIPLGCVGLLLSFSGQTSSSRLHRGVIHAAVFGMAVALSFGPWLVRNVITTGNPLHPYAPGFAQSQTEGETDPEVGSRIGSFEIGPEKIPLALSLGTFKRRGHAGDIGPVHLWLFPLGLLWVWRNRRRPEVGAVFGVFLLSLFFWALGPTLGRYLVPTLAVSAALLGGAWTDLVDLLGVRSRGVVTVALYVFLLANCSPFRAEYIQSQLECAFGVRDEIELLTRRVSSYEPGVAANENLPANAKILLVAEPRAFGFDRDVIVEDGFREPLLVTLAEQAASEADIADALRELGVTHILWNQSEASRLAAAAGREDYLECRSARGRERLDGFRTDSTRILVRGAWWEIVALED